MRLTILSSAWRWLWSVLRSGCEHAGPVEFSGHDVAALWLHAATERTTRGSFDIDLCACCTSRQTAQPSVRQSNTLPRYCADRGALQCFGSVSGGDSQRDPGFAGTGECAVE